MRSAVAGIFVGGAATRMGGVAKGLMRLPGGGPTLVTRWCATLEGLCTEVVLVGRHPAYAPLGIESLADEPPGIGPLGGLVALLRRGGNAHVLAFACDMPFVGRALVERLVGFAGDSPAVAPRRDGKWEPLCARYDPRRILPVALDHVRLDHRSLQRLLDAAGATELPLEGREAEELRDWDTPEDATPGQSAR